MSLARGLEHIVREGELLAPYTSLRLGGEAQYFAEPTHAEELAQLLSRCREQGLPARLAGGGSNLLIRDEGVAGLVVHLGAADFCRISAADNAITAGGGAKLSLLISSAVREGLAGIEQLVGIPGTVGGGLRGNVTCHGADLGSYTRSASVMHHDGEIRRRSGDELLFTYRGSSLDELVVLEARFELERGDPVELTKRMQKAWIVNKASQPLRDQHTAMLFKDHGGISAASLIEDAGLQKTRVGQVYLSDRHANYVVSESGARAREVLELIDHLREGVQRRLGIELETAIDIW